ncbi:hypothetical protein Poly41_57060 [Novipirellula artificiosorum]|uniref:Uncharacterized protein n=1 Tax=Novipirellula artificiosorum TaxID=2528016 RepID=A0A5C6D8V4_9BACT|nr:hypothetical protein Poly41_57060 [Novipirellula artificiosorum]
MGKLTGILRCHGRLDADRIEAGSEVSAPLVWRFLRSAHVTLIIWSIRSTSEAYCTQYKLTRRGGAYRRSVPTAGLSFTGYHPRSGADRRDYRRR